MQADDASDSGDGENRALKKRLKSQETSKNSRQRLKEAEAARVAAMQIMFVVNDNDTNSFSSIQATTLEQDTYGCGFHDCNENNIGFKFDALELHGLNLDDDAEFLDSIQQPASSSLNTSWKSNLNTPDLINAQANRLNLQQLITTNAPPPEPALYSLPCHNYVMAVGLLKAIEARGYTRPPVTFTRLSTLIVAITKHPLHLAEYLGANCDLLVLPDCSYLQKLNHLNPLDSQGVPDYAHSYSHEVFDPYLMAEVHGKRGVGVYPPLQVSSMLDNKYRHDAIFRHLMLPSYHGMFPTDFGGSGADWMEVHNEAWNKLETAGSKAGHALVLSDNREDVVEQGLVLKPLAAPPGPTGVVFLEPTMNEDEEADEIVTSVVAKTCTNVGLPDTTPLLPFVFDADNNQVPTPYVVQPYSDDLRHKEYRIMGAVQSNGSGFSKIYGVTTRLTSMGLHAEQEGVWNTKKNDGFEPTKTAVANALVQQWPSSKLDWRFHADLLIRIDCFKDADYGTFVNGVSVFPRTRSFITHTWTQQQAIQQLSSFMEKYIVRNVNKWHV